MNVSPYTARLTTAGARLAAMTGHRRFDVVVRGYERTQVETHLTRVEDARRAGVAAPAPPEFTVVLRGYDRAQVDRHLDALADEGPARSWTVRHFSQANPRGKGQGDVPALMRRVAGDIEQLGPVEVQDIVFSTEITEEGGWPSLTVYFHAAEDLP